MAFEPLKAEACAANLELVEKGLVILTWGNASACDAGAGVMAIKPSGVPYGGMTPSDMVVLHIDSGEILDGKGRPSSDTPTHLHLYRRFPDLGGIVHTHSHYASVWAQAGLAIPCLGTTHADYFNGDIPCTRPLSESEVAGEYELLTGEVIAQTLLGLAGNWHDAPAVLVAQHAPFTFGATAAKAVENAFVLEEVARMALETRQLAPTIGPIPAFLLNKHYQRKHGPAAYYGQAEVEG